MTQSELIKVALTGERIPKQRCSLHEKENSIVCTKHYWRAVVCNGEQDVVECAHCGKQEVRECNFDDEYA